MFSDGGAMSNITDPVDTDALRRDARVLAPGFPGVEQRLNAAADEVDRLRATSNEHAAHARRMNQRNAKSEGLHQAEKYRRERVEQKIDRRNLRLRELEHDIEVLRAVIENAPHMNSCRMFDPADRKCTCWKADAL